MEPRRESKAIHIGNVTIGGGNPIIVQSMTSTDTRDVMSTIHQIKELEEVDCELVRVAVPDMEAARSIREIKNGISIPLVADIHFDYRLALASLEAGCDGLRLNPGNIDEPDKVSAVAKAAKERDVPIRIGLNAGSLPKTTDPTMSSFRVSNDHLSMLVSAASRAPFHLRPRWRADGGGWATVGKPRESTPHLSTVSPQELGTMLADWNDCALEARYGEGTEAAEPGPAFEWTPADDIAPLDPVVALKALDCLEYQCAEFEGWDDCEAYRFAQALRRSLGVSDLFDGGD